MKHIIDVTVLHQYTKTPDFIINNATDIVVDFNNEGLFPRIIIPRSEVQRYVNEKKVFYIHTYGDIFNIKGDVYATIFVYNNKTKRYHIAIIQEHIFNSNTAGSLVEFIDLSTRIGNDKDYWMSTYCEFNYEKFHIYQTSLTGLFDTVEEAVEDMMTQVIKKYTYQVGVEKAIVTTLDNPELYEREFNKLLDERLEEIKRRITSELDTKKRVAEKNISKLSEKITNINEQLIVYKNGNPNA